MEGSVQLKILVALGLAVVSAPLISLAYYALPYSLLLIPVVIISSLVILWKRFDD